MFFNVVILRNQAYVCTLPMHPLPEKVGVVKPPQLRLHAVLSYQRPCRVGHYDLRKYFFVNE